MDWCSLCGPNLWAGKDRAENPKAYIPLQNTWRRVLALGNAPDSRILRWGYQHIGILEPTQTLASGVICVSPDASQWNIGGVRAGVGHVHFMFFV